MKPVTLLSLMFIVAALGPVPAAHASALTIRVLGLDAVYDGFDLYDAGSPFGGNQDPTESDPLIAVEFLLDGTPRGTLTTQIYGDFAIVGLPPIPAGGGTVTSAFGGFFDLLTSNGGWGLGLDFTAFEITYAAGGVSVSGIGTAASIFGQALPFGLVAGGPVMTTLLFDNVSGIGVDNQGMVDSFTATGSAEITAAAVPEPSTLLLVGVGFLLTARRIARHRV